MILPYEIRDLDGRDYLVHFEFHRERDGKPVYDSAFTTQAVIGYGDDEQMVWYTPTPEDDSRILDWLSSGGEATIYIEATRVFKW